MAPGPSNIILIGNDASLTYLVGRYAEQGGYKMTLLINIPSAQEVCDLHPAAILFPSMERLESAQSLIQDLANCEVPVLVWTSIADETRAREMGADHCLTQPLTFDGFLAALQLQ
jgi:DNA-binding response OmpR family regulator